MHRYPVPFRIKDQRHVPVLFRDLFLSLQDLPPCLFHPGKLIGKVSAEGSEIDDHSIRRGLIKFRHIDQ